MQHSEVDVFQAVKTVRRHRPQLISNMVSHRPYKQHKQHNGPPTPTAAHLKHGQSPPVQTTQTTQQSADTDRSSSQTWSVTVRTNNTNNTTVRRHRPQLISNMVSHRPYKQHKQHNGPPTPTTAHLKHGQSPPVQTTQTTQRSADTDHSSSQTWSVTVRTNNTNNTTVRRHRPQLISNMVSHRPYKQHERLNKMAVLIERCFPNAAYQICFKRRPLDGSLSKRLKLCCTARHPGPAAQHSCAQNMLLIMPARWLAKQAPYVMLYRMTNARNAVFSGAMIKASANIPWM